jgi:CheY-like chemotaxis protein
VTVDLEKVSGGAESMTLPAWRILVVDDNEDVCRTASLSLTELGVKPSSCRSGEEAVELVAEAKRRGEDFFAVLIDYRLEGMNGIQTAIRIREVVGDEVPIRIISAYDWSDIEEEAAGALINGFIPKPLFKSTLYYELRKYADNPEETDLTASPQKQEGISGMRILLAEDNDLNAEIAMMILEESGCVVNRAPDGRAAASMFENSAIGDYDAILMDLRMPNMDGIEATRAIRAMDRSDASSIPIIAMTADAFAEDARKCMEAGMNAHLAKPIDVDQLTRTLVRLVRGL